MTKPYYFISSMQTFLFFSFILKSQVLSMKKWEDGPIQWVCIFQTNQVRIGKFWKQNKGALKFWELERGRDEIEQGREIRKDSYTTLCAAKQKAIIFCCLSFFYSNHCIDSTCSICIDTLQKPKCLLLSLTSTALHTVVTPL